MFTLEEVEQIKKADKEMNHGWTTRINSNMRLVSCHIPVVVLDEINKMVRNGRFIHRSEAIRAMLKEYIDNRKVSNTE